MRYSLAAATIAFGLALSGAAQAERLTDAPLVDANWLQSHLNNDSLVVLDIRDANKDADPYALGHIPGAVNTPYGASGWRTEVDGVHGMLPPTEQIADLISRFGVDNDEHVVIVPFGVDSSDFGSATRIYWTFKVLGHDAVSILDGGYQGWTGELSTTSVTPEPSVFEATLRPELLATTADVQQAMKDGVALVDGRPTAQFSGESKSPVVRAPGTIPGAVNITNASLYDSENASFVSSDRVAQLATGVGVAGDEEAIAFCNTGHWASVIWFGLSEVQGNKNVKMYDGSMTEWAADPARPLQ